MSDLEAAIGELADQLKAKRLEINPDGMMYVRASNSSDFVWCGWADALNSVEVSLRKLLATISPPSELAEYLVGRTELADREAAEAEPQPEPESTFGPPVERRTEDDGA